MKNQVRIPTLIGLFILTIGVAAGVLLVGQRQLFRLTASPQESPNDVRITNITDTSFTVSWITQKQTTGAILFGTSSSLGQTSQDKVSPSPTHHVTIENLKPQTKYFFKILSGSATFGQNDRAWAQTTAPALPFPPSDIISGSVKDKIGNPVENSLVYVTFPGSSPLSAVTTKEGNFLISLSSSRTTNLSTFAKYDKTTILSIFVQTGSGDKNCCSSAQVAVGNAKPVPPLTLDQSHDFRKLAPEGELTSPKSNIELPSASPSSQVEPKGFSLEPIGGGAPEAPETLSVENPKEGERISTAKPEFRGKAPAGKIIDITLESPAQTGEITVSANGTWLWSPTQTLTQGQHKLTVSMKDEQGKTQTAERNFIVASAGLTPAFVATPSAIATPSPTTTPSATLPSTQAGIPAAGNLTITFLLFILGLVSIFGGILLFRANPKF